MGSKWGYRKAGFYLLWEWLKNLRRIFLKLLMAVQMQQNYLKNDYIFKKKKCMIFAKTLFFSLLLLLLLLLLFSDKVIYLK